MTMVVIVIVVVVDVVVAGDMGADIGMAVVLMTS